MFNQLIYSFNDTAMLIITIISGVTGLISLMNFFRKKEDTKSKWINIVVLLFSCVIIFTYFYSLKLVKVPDVIDDSYDVACIKLGNCNLLYTQSISNDKMKVVNQAPEAGTIVNERTFVELELIEVGRVIIDDVHEKLKEEDVQFCTLKLRYHIDEMRIFNTITRNVDDYYGEQIYDPAISEIKIKNIDNNLIYTEYIDSDGIIQFNDIPAGFRYEITSDIVGYETMITNTELKYNSTYEEEWRLAIYLEPKGEGLRWGTGIQIVDENREPIAGVDCIFGDAPNQMRGSTYRTNTDGMIEGVQIEVLKDKDVYVHIVNPYNKEEDYVCQVLIKKRIIEEGASLDYPVIKLFRDGNYEVKTSSEFYYH